jgi:hypothetical protein
MTSVAKTCRAAARVLFVLLFVVICSRSYAQAPRIFVTGRSPMNFGTVKTGKDSTRSFFIINTDSNRGPVHVQIIGPNSSNFKLLTPSTFQVDPTKFDTVRIAFSPQGEGKFVDSFFIAHDADTTRTKNPIVVLMTGVGLSASDTSPRILVSVPGLQINSIIDTFRTAKFLIRNVSDTMRYLSGTVTGIQPPFSFLSGDSAFTLKTGDTATYIVKFAPTVAINYSDTLHIRSNSDSLHNDIVFVIRGVATDPHPSISLSSHYVDFGVVMVGKDSMVELILGNTGNSGILYDSVIGPTSSAFAVTLGLGDSVRQPKQTLAIDVKFDPSVVGTFTDSLVINTNAASVDRHIVVPLTGIGQAPASVAVPEKTAAFVIEVGKHTVRILNPSAFSGAEASVFDEAGACRMTVPVSSSSSTELDLGNLPHGSYFVEVTAGSRSQIKRVVR